MRAVSTQNRAGLRIKRIHMRDPVVFFVRPGQFMAPDGAAGIGRERSAASQANLAVSRHAHAVDKKTWFGALKHGAAIDKGVQIMRRAIVNFSPMGVGTGGEIDFRARYMQEVSCLAIGALTRFLGGHDIIGGRNNFRRVFARSAQRIERRNHALIHRLCQN